MNSHDAKMQKAQHPAVVERITQLVYRNSLSGQIICIVIALALALTYRVHVEHTLLLYWLGSTWAVAGWRIYTAYQYQQQSTNGTIDNRLWIRRFVQGVTVSGLVWGIGGFFLLLAAPDLLRIFTAFVLSGVVSGAVPIVGAHYQAFRNFALLILLPVIPAALLGNGPLAFVLAIMCALYIIVVIKGVRNYHDAIVESILLEVEQKKLIEDLELARNKAEAASSAKSEFIANVSHEIRTPMNGIVGMTHILAQSNLSESQREDLAVIQSSSDLLLALVNDVLDISKIESSQFEVNEQNFDLAQLLRTTQQIFLAAAKEKQLELRLKLQPHVLPLFYGDVIRLQQILVNLIGNAIKFTQAGHVSIDCWLENEVVNFVVSDSGIGIAADRLPYIFDAFVQADGSLARQYGGTGLGLTIAQKLVAYLGGELQVTSELGRGTRFSFSIRLKVAKESTSSSAPWIELPFERALNILLAEDNPTNQLVASKIIESAGHKVTCADNGLLAVEAAASQAFDLILMDMQMPVMDGLEATRHIRLYDQTTPIIALTANAMEADREACLAAGMNEFMTKPIRPELLYAKMRAILC